jgi:hypothetical protein
MASGRKEGVLNACDRVKMLGADSGLVFEFSVFRFSQELWLWRSIGMKCFHRVT